MINPTLYSCCLNVILYIPKIKLTRSGNPFRVFLSSLRLTWDKVYHHWQVQHCHLHTHSLRFALLYFSHKLFHFRPSLSLPLPLGGEAACTAKPRRLLIKERITFSPIPLSSSFRFPKRNQIISMYIRMCVFFLLCNLFFLLVVLIFMFCECTNVCFVTTFFGFWFCFEKFHTLTKWVFFFLELNTRTQIGLESTTLTGRRRKCYMKLIRSKKH